MALLIKSTTNIIPEVAEQTVDGGVIPFQPSYDNGKKLTIQGTQIVLENIYCRILGMIDYDGVTMNLAFRFYDKKETYQKDKNQSLPINGLGDSLCRIINNPMDLIYSAHDIAKEYFEEYGYEVEVIDI